MNNKIRPAGKYPGGKYYLASEIIKIFPEHLTFIEPYFGMGNVLLQKNPYNKSEIINDIDGHLMNFWKVLQDEKQFKRFKRKIEATPFSQQLFDEAKHYLNSDKPGAVEKAVAFFIVLRQSYQGMGQGWAVISTTRIRSGMNEQVSSWLSSIEGLDIIHDRLKRVVILNDNAINVIKKYDKKDVLFYLDPPYLHETRVAKKLYKFELDKGQHEILLKTLSELKNAKFVLSGYYSDLYNDYATKYKWNHLIIKTVAHSSSKKKKGNRDEYLWFNFNIEDNSC